MAVNKVKIANRLYDKLRLEINKFESCYDVDSIVFVDLISMARNLSRAKNITFRRAKKLMAISFYSLVEEKLERAAYLTDGEDFPEDFDLEDITDLEDTFDE